MTEWLYEAGIGENRAALIEDGSIVEALIEVDDEGPRAGAVHAAVLRADRIVDLDSGEQALIDAVPKGLAEGARIKVRITREALSEPRKPKRAKARLAEADANVGAGPSLLDRIRESGVLFRRLSPHDFDALEAAGWSEAMEEARTGFVAFAEGSLQISLTPAMTLIDIDGRDADALHIAAGRAAGEALRRLDITGNIGIDFPTIEDRALRRAAADAVAAALVSPFEATAINGFGFMQIIRPRARASLLELAQYDRIGWAARALLRQAQRSRLHGPLRLTARPAVIAYLAQRGGWLDRLASETGGAISLQEDAGLAISAGNVAKA